jgi:hypothetical protein
MILGLNLCADRHFAQTLCYQQFVVTPGHDKFVAPGLYRGEAVENGLIRADHFGG